MQMSNVLNSLSPSNIASKCCRKLCYGKISFALLIPEYMRERERERERVKRRWNLKQNLGSSVCSKPFRQLNLYSSKHLVGGGNIEPNFFALKW